MNQSCNVNNINSLTTKVLNVANKEKPAELYTAPKTLVTNPNLDTVHLLRGQYQIKGTIKNYNGDNKQILDKQIAVKMGGDFKRLQFHKLDIVSNNDGTANYTAIVSVMDNQFILGGIVIGIATIGSLVAGSVFVSKVQSFSKSTAGSLVEIGIVGFIVIAGYYFFIKK